MIAKKILSSVKRENGFTLMEVLVTLVLASFFITILLDAALSNKTRKIDLNLQTKAALIAAIKIESLRDSPGILSNKKGEEHDLNWEIIESEVMRDPRQIYVLVEAQIIVGTKDKPSLITRKKRYIKNLVRP